jgi:hypothetical protein
MLPSIASYVVQLDAPPPPTGRRAAAASGAARNGAASGFDHQRECFGGAALTRRAEEGDSSVKRPLT